MNPQMLQATSPLPAVIPSPDEAKKKPIKADAPVTYEEKTADIPTDQSALDIAKADIVKSINYARDNAWEAWGNWWKHYNNERIPGKVGYKGIADAFEPMTYNNIETNIANVFGSKPKVVYWPTKKEQYQETKVLNQMWEYTWSRNNMSEKVIPFGRELYVTGNAAMWATWKDDWVEFKHRDIKSCLFDPVPNPEDFSYAGYRELVAIEDLKAVQIYDGKKWKSKYDLSGVQAYTGDPELDADIEECYEGSTLPKEDRDKQVELICLYYVKGPLKGQVVEVVNRSKVAFQDDSPFQRKAETRDVMTATLDENGAPALDPQTQEPLLSKQSMDIPEIKPFLPVAFQRDVVVPGEVYGKGEVEPNAGQQELLNDTVNQKRDNITHNINNTIVVDPAYEDMISKIKNLPNSVYPISPGAIEYINKPDMTGTADDEINRIRQSMRETAAIDEVVAGLRPDKAATATQINTQVNQAGQRFSIKLQGLENGSYRRLAQIAYWMFQLFVTDQQIVRLTGNKGLEWIEYNPDYFWGDYEANVQLESNVKAQRAEEVQRIESAANLVIGNPYVNQQELIRVVMSKLLEFDDDVVDGLMAKMPGGVGNPSNPAAAHMTQMPGVPFHPLTKLLETIDFADLPEDAKHELLQQVGIQSQMLSPAGTTQMNAHQSATLNAAQVAAAPPQMLPGTDAAAAANAPSQNGR